MVGLQKIIDVSFAGTQVKIGGVTITDFIDDANPIEFQDADVANIEWSCNGRMIRTVKPSAVLVSVTVIPGSSSDNQLKKLWKERFISGGNVSLTACDKDLDCTIDMGDPSKGSYHFIQGTCISGAPGVGANGAGKLGGNTYTFAFERVA